MTEPNTQTGTKPASLWGLPRSWLTRGAALLALFVVLGVIGYRWMRDDSLATLRQFSGPTERDLAQKPLSWLTAQQGDRFDNGDGARTSEASLAHFDLRNGARLRLKPQSQVRFTRNAQQGLGLQVEVGEAELETGNQAISIASEFGEIVLDAGSRVHLRREGGRLEVDVELGRIQLGQRAVAAGQQAVLELGGIVLDVPVADALPSAQPAQAGSAVPSVAATGSAAAASLALGDGVAHADLVVAAGASFVVHDPSPPAAIGFDLGKLCNGAARVTAGKQYTEAEGQANLSFTRGQHPYEVRCLAAPDVVVAKGNVRVLQDGGTAQLPTFAPSANVVTDGRRYTVLYQHRLPNVTVTWPTAPQAQSYTLTVNGRHITTRSPSYTFKALARGKHEVIFAAQTTPPRQSRTSTIEVVYDVQAPAARVAEPPLDFEAQDSIAVRGQALPGWSVSIGGQPLEIDAQNKFSTELAGRSTIPIVFSHPTYGTHYYLRRPRQAP